MTKHELLTPELKKQILMTWAERSRLRAIELVEAELRVSHVDAIAIIDSLEEDYLTHIKAPRIGKRRMSVGQFFFSDPGGISLVMLFVFGVALILSSGITPAELGGFVAAVVVIFAVAFVIGSSMGGGSG